MKALWDSSMRSSSTYRIPNRVFVEKVIDRHDGCRGARISVYSGLVYSAVLVQGIGVDVHDGELRKCGSCKGKVRVPRPTDHRLPGEIQTRQAYTKTSSRLLLHPRFSFSFALDIPEIDSPPSCRPHSFSTRRPSRGSVIAVPSFRSIANE